MNAPNTSAGRISLLTVEDALRAYLYLLRESEPDPVPFPVIEPEPLSVLDSKILRAVTRGCDYVGMIEQFMADERQHDDEPRIDYWLIDSQLHQMRRAGLVVNVGGAWRIA